MPFFSSWGRQDDLLKDDDINDTNQQQPVSKKDPREQPPSDDSDSDDSESPSVQPRLAAKSRDVTKKKKGSKPSSPKSIASEQSKESTLDEYSSVAPARERSGSKNKSKAKTKAAVDAAPKVSVPLDPDRKSGLHRRTRSRSHNDLNFLAQFSGPQDPFSAKPAEDPFHVNTAEDPFSAKTNKNPFGDNGNIDDPFADRMMSASAPQNGSKDPFALAKDPFASEDPFADLPTAESAEDPFGESGNPFADAPASLKVQQEPPVLETQGAHPKKMGHRRTRSRSSNDVSLLAAQARSTTNSNSADPFAQNQTQPGAAMAGFAAPQSSQFTVAPRTIAPRTTAPMVMSHQQMMPPMGTPQFQTMQMGMGQQQPMHMGSMQGMQQQMMSGSAPMRSLSQMPPNWQPNQLGVQCPQPQCMVPNLPSPESVLSHPPATSNPFADGFADPKAASSVPTSTGFGATQPQSTDVFDQKGEKNPFSLTFLSGGGGPKI